MGSSFSSETALVANALFWTGHITACPYTVALFIYLFHDAEVRDLLQHRLNHLKMSLFRRKPVQRPMISWPVDRPVGDIRRLPVVYPTLYSPIASSPSTDFSFASRWPLKDGNDSQVTLPAPLPSSEDISIILDVYPPPPPPPKDEPKDVQITHMQTERLHVEDASAEPSEKEAPPYQPKDFQAV